MQCHATTTTTTTTTIVRMTASLYYEQEGLIYIRYDAPIVQKGNGQKNIGGTRPAFSKLTEPPRYERGSGKYYSLLMGVNINQVVSLSYLTSTTRSKARFKTAWTLWKN